MDFYRGNSFVYNVIDLFFFYIIFSSADLQDNEHSKLSASS